MSRISIAKERRTAATEDMAATAEIVVVAEDVLAVAAGAAVAVVADDMAEVATAATEDMAGAATDVSARDWRGLPQVKKARSGHEFRGPCLWFHVVISVWLKAAAIPPEILCVSRFD